MPNSVNNPRNDVAIQKRNNAGFRPYFLYQNKAHI